MVFLRGSESSFDTSNRQTVTLSTLHIFCSLLFPSTLENTIYMNYRFNFVMYLCILLHCEMSVAVHCSVNSPTFRSYMLRPSEEY